MVPPPARPARPIPADLTSFVGRRHDLAAIRQLFGSARLVTLTGMGGVGKTRLALQAASELQRAFPGGIYFVELTGLRDPDLLPQTVQDALGLPEATGTPVAALEEFVRERSMLLILDNCEHLIEATADLADHLLRVAPELKILVTSRQAMRLVGEHLYPVAPLLTPDPEDTLGPGRASKYPAVALFADRAAAIVPGFALSEENERAVVRLCHRLEGIPLAIELACVRLRALTVNELAGRLDDRFEMLREGSRNLPARHQTLQALIDWSHDLCTPIEQLLWARSSIFAGGFGIDALEAVCTDERFSHDAVIDTVARLVDKSILIREEQGGHTRFRMLETIREYGRAMLAASPDSASIPRRHRDWCAGLIASASVEWSGPRQEEWAKRLRREHANIRQALDYSMASSEEAAIGLEMAAVPWFWGAMDHLTEARLWLDRGLALHQEPSLASAWAYATAAYIAGFQGDHETLTAWADRAHAIGVEIGDVRVLAFANHVRAFGRSLGSGADLASAIPLYDLALEQYAACPDIPRQYAESLMVELAVTLIMMDDFDRATAVVDQVHTRCNAAGERWNLSYALWLRGLLALIKGDPRSAERELFEALRIKQVFHDTLGLGLTFEVVAWVAAAEEEPERAARLLGATDQIWSTLGARQMSGLRRRYEAMARKQLGTARFEAAFAQGRSLNVDALVALALRESSTDEAVAQQPARTHGLTSRELQVAHLVADGMSNKEIAARLVISLRTAEGHVVRVLTKLGFKSRSQIATWVAEQSASDNSS